MGLDYNKSDSLKARIVFMLKDNPGLVRTEVRDRLKMQNNIVGPAIKELVDDGILVEGPVRVSTTTNKTGKTLYLATDWQKELDAQNRVFE